MMKKSFSTANRPTANSCSRLQIAPVGLAGELMMMARVRAVTAAQILRKAGIKPSASVAGIITALPPAMAIISG